MLKCDQVIYRKKFLAKHKNDREEQTPTTIDLKLGLVPDAIAGYLGLTPSSKPIQPSGGKAALLSKQRMIKKMDEGPKNFEPFSTAPTEAAKKLKEKLRPKTVEDLIEELKIL